MDGHGTVSEETPDGHNAATVDSMFDREALCLLTDDPRENIGHLFALSGFGSLSQLHTAMSKN